MSRALALLLLTGAAWAQTDRRFAGDYCGSASFRQCVDVQVCFIVCWNETHCQDVSLTDLKTHVRHWDRGDGVGLIQGSGSGAANGQPLMFNFGAAVLQTGLARGSLASNFFDPYAGDARLSADGLALVISAMGHDVMLRKDACGNAPPRVTVAAEGAGPVTLTGTFSDDHDRDLPDDQLIFASSVDGELHGVRTHTPGRVTLQTSLTPGSHTLIFTAIDNGGLSGAAAIPFEVRAPAAPPSGGGDVLLQPRPGASLVADALTLFELLHDGCKHVDWMLSGKGHEPRTLGTGCRVVARLPAAGAWELRATADGRALVQRTIEVAPKTKQPPPHVRLVSPRPTCKGFEFSDGDWVALEAVVDAEGKVASTWTLEGHGTVVQQTKGNAALFRVQAGEWTANFEARNADGLTTKLAVPLRVLAPAAALTTALKGGVR